MTNSGVMWVFTLEEMFEPTSEGWLTLAEWRMEKYISRGLLAQIPWGRNENDAMEKQKKRALLIEKQWVKFKITEVAFVV